MTVDVLAPAPVDGVLTDDALAFVGALHERFEPRRRELLAEHEPQAARHPVDLVVAYHDACHLAHAQGVRAQPRALLATIPGLDVREPAEWELCCGSAGVWNLLNPEPAAELGQRKARNLLDTGAEAVAAANPGCALQIAVHAGLPVHHPMEVLAASIHGRKP